MGGGPAAINATRRCRAIETQGALEPVIAQSTWRKVGLASTAGAILLVGSGAYFGFFRNSIVTFTLFCTAIAALFFVSVVTAILDFRYIRLQYAAAQRELFRQTLGDESFRAALRDAQRRAKSPNANARAKKDPPDSPSSPEQT